MQQEKIIRNLIPIGLIGNSIVGKSSLSNVFVGEKFNEDIITTIGIDCFMKDIYYKFKGEKDERKIKIKIWDTAGQEKFRSVGLKYINNCYGIIVVYSVTDENSFNEVDYWIEQIQNSYDLSKYPFILVGNKCDLIDERIISKEEGEKKAKEYNIKFFETSARNDINVNESFMSLIENVFEKYHDEFVKEPEEKTVEVVEDKIPKKKRKCFFSFN